MNRTCSVAAIKSVVSVHLPIFTGKALMKSFIFYELLQVIIYRLGEITFLEPFFLDILVKHWQTHSRRP